MNTITPEKLHDLYRGGEPLHLLDVRTPREFRDVHVAFARNVPLDALDPAAIVRSLNGASGQPIFVICHGGGRGAKACAKFLAAGFNRVVNVEGGTTACVAMGLPVVRGKKAISLERQVRIVAGLLVLAGSALGYFVHPYFIGLAAFVGAGLTFAGITDTCGMGMLLARMPWNQVTPTTRTSSVGATPTSSTCRVGGVSDADSQPHSGDTSK